MIWGALLGGKTVAFIVAAILVSILAIMRLISANDPHRLNQFLMMLGRWSRGRHATLYWGNRSVCPMELNRRRVVSLDYTD